MKYIVKWIEFERAPGAEVYVLTAPLEFHNIVNVIKVHYSGGSAGIMRCLCLLEKEIK